MSVPSVAVVLPAAGAGVRLGAGVPKAFVELAGVPLWRQSLDAMLNVPAVRRVVLVGDFPVPPVDERVIVAAGGATRAHSVANGIERCGECDLIAVHDAARPLVSRADVEAVLAAAAGAGAAILAAPIASTVKRVAGGVITGTVPRDDLWAAQTPQVARADLMRRAYAQRRDVAATDEAALLERIGVPVSVVAGSARNFKITTPADLALAEAVLRADAADAEEGRTDA